MTMPEKLDRDRILALLEKADCKWFAEHSGTFKYREHLEHTADYITSNYHKYKKKARDV